MECLFGDKERQKARKISYIEIRGPKSANLLPLRNMLVSEVGSDNVQIYINRDYEPNNVEILKRKGNNTLKVYDGPGSEQNFGEILRYVKSN